MIPNRWLRGASHVCPVPVATAAAPGLYRAKTRCMAWPGVSLAELGSLSIFFDRVSEESMTPVDVSSTITAVEWWVLLRLAG